MGVSTVLSIGEVIAGGIGGVAVGGMLKDSSFGKTVNAVIGIVGGVALAICCTQPCRILRIQSAMARWPASWAGSSARSSAREF